MAAAATSRLLLLAALLLAVTTLIGPAAAGTSVSSSSSSSSLGCLFVGWLQAIVGVPPVCQLGSNNPTSPYPFGSPKDAPKDKGLSVGHYSNKSSSSYCPDVEKLVRNAVEAATNKSRGIGAGLIRLHFHDAFVRGCDASVLLNTTASGNPNTERTGPPNANSLRGFEVIDAAKEAVESACPGVVSCADILALAARDASNILSNGNIKYEVPVGRYDGRESLASETSQLPGPGSNVKQLNDSFRAQGLTLYDAVTLSASHSIGVARCRFFKTRLESDMDQDYADKLRAECSAGDDTRVSQDPVTPDVLDNEYYKNIGKRYVLFASDATLNSTDPTFDQVKANVQNPRQWEKEFAEAMVKMGKIGVTTSASIGSFEIRKVCWKVNDLAG